MRVQFLDRAMALAAQAFTALIPLLILLGTLAPATQEDLLPEAVIRRFRLSDDAADAVRAVFSASGDATVGAFSVVLLVFSGVSFARRLQRLYGEVWEQPRQGGVRNSLNALLGLTVLLAGVVLLYLTRALARVLPSGWLLSAPATAVAALLLWTSVPWLLLDRRVLWRRLLPTGALAAGGTAAYGVVTAAYMPPLFASYSLRYGLFGVTLALVGWLLSLALIVVCAAGVGAEIDRAPESWARRLRDLLRISRPSAGPAVSVPGCDGGGRSTGSPAGRRGGLRRVPGR
ncbi:YhjD/YihY/BrkB family envelope integrity protein [Blastococcus sp. SYSU D01042]